MSRLVPLIVIIAVVAIGALPAAASASTAPNASRLTLRNAERNHCISPEGADINHLLGISEQVFFPGVCDVVQTGEYYVYVSPPWIVNTSWEAVPADYTPSAPTPIQDFTSKVRSLTYVVDPGTKHERSYRFTAQDIMDVRTIRDFFPETGPDWPIALFLAKLPPLPPGDHRLGVIIEMSARHCDGLGSEPTINCLRAGFTELTVCPFTVVPRNERAARP